MNAKTFDKTMLPSRDVTEGPTRAARRSHLSQQMFASAAVRLLVIAGDKAARVGVGRFSRATGESLIGHDGPEIGVGDAIGLIQDRDIASIDAVERTLDRDVSGEELVAHTKAWAPAKTFRSGAMHNYAGQRDRMCSGAITQAGGKAEVVCYADT